MHGPAPDAADTVCGPPQTHRGRLRGLLRSLRGVYTRELPRIVKDLRWLLLVLALVEIAGAVVGWRAGMRASFGEYAQNTGGVPPFPPFNLPFPLVGSDFWGSSWLGYFGPNSLRALFAWCYSALTLGLYAFHSAWLNGWRAGWTICGYLPYAKAATGAGPAFTSAVTLLPHGVIEYPTFLLAWALGLRAGVAWLRREPGRGRWASVKARARDFRTALAAIVPLLLSAALLEAYVARPIGERYVFGIGASPRLRSERPAPPPFLPYLDSDHFAVYPDGRSVAQIAWPGSLSLRSPNSRKARRLLRLEDDILTGPSWSPDGKQIAVVSSPLGTDRHSDAPCQLFLADGVSGRKRVVSSPALLRFYDPAWSPNGQEIAVRGVLSPPDGSGKRPSDIWAVQVHTGRWRRITHLPFSTSLCHDLSGPAWSPDARSIAFTRKTGVEDSYQIWVVRADGTGLRRLTHGARDAGPAWSPDGKWIAFRSCPPKPDWEKELDESRPYVRQEFGLATLGLIRPDGKGRIDGLVKADNYSHLSWTRDSKALYYTRFFTLIKGTPRLK